MLAVVFSYDRHKLELAQIEMIADGCPVGPIVETTLSELPLDSWGL